MRKINKIAGFFLIPILFPLALGAAEKRLVFQGHAAVPLVDKNGNCLIFHQNPSRGISLAVPTFGTETPQVEDIISTPSLPFLAAAQNINGETGIVWEQSGPAKDRLYFGLLQGGRLMSAVKIAESAPSIFSPDLAFDSYGAPWVVWVQQADQRYFVLVKNLRSGSIWIVNRGLFKSAATPRLVAAGDQRIWVFWVGQDLGHDEVFASALEGRAWSRPHRLNADGRFPHLSPSVALDGNGYPWVVWSAYDGHDYEIYSSFWNGRTWSSEDKITDDGDSDSTPTIAFAYGTVPLVVWSRVSGRTSILACKVKSGPAWGPEIALFSSEGVFNRSPRVAIQGGRVALTWQSGDSVGFLGLSFQELIGFPPLCRKFLDYPPVFNPALDDNQYTGFGDSITYAEEHGYLPKLEVKLQQKYGPSKVINEGIGGEGTIDGLARFDDVLSAHRARYLFIMEGTNDIISLEISTDTSAFNLEAMALKCLNFGAFPLLATIIPRNDWRWNVPIYKNRILDLNAKIRSLTDKIKIPLVDQFNAFYNYPAADGGWQSLLLPDGVHPNETGFYLMADTWFGQIVPLPFPPAHLKLERMSNEILFYRQSGNMIYWQNSPKIDTSAGVAGYRIYRKDLASVTNRFALLAYVPRSLDLLEYRYFDIRIVQPSRYTYVISAIREDGLEGPCAEVVQND